MSELNFYLSQTIVETQVLTRVFSVRREGAIFFVAFSDGDSNIGSDSDNNRDSDSENNINSESVNNSVIDIDSNSVIDRDSDSNSVSDKNSDIGRDNNSGTHIEMIVKVHKPCSERSW